MARKKKCQRKPPSRLRMTVQVVVVTGGEVGWKGTRPRYDFQQCICQRRWRIEFNTGQGTHLNRRPIWEVGVRRKNNGSVLNCSRIGHGSDAAKTGPEPLRSNWKCPGALGRNLVAKAKG